MPAQVPPTQPARTHSGRSTNRDPSIHPDSPTIPEEILSDPEIDLIVEEIDTAEAACRIVRKIALQKGIPMVSGCKTMLARHLPELIDIQKKYEVALLYDASSCGSIPVIRNLEEYYDNDLPFEVKGILNGSYNYILSRVFDHSDTYTNALAMAQALEFAESDPSFDIDGYDALFKLVIITVRALEPMSHRPIFLPTAYRPIHESGTAMPAKKGLKSSRWRKS